MKWACTSPMFAAGFSCSAAPAVSRLAGKAKIVTKRRKRLSRTRERRRGGRRERHHSLVTTVRSAIFVASLRDKRVQIGEAGFEPAAERLVEVHDEIHRFRDQRAGAGHGPCDLRAPALLRR